MNDLSFDLVSLAHAYDDGLTPERLVDLVFDRIAACGDPGIFITLAERDMVLAQARALGPRDGTTPLWGVPCAVKDNIDVAGLPTTAACPAFTYEPARDATCVAKLRAAGALIVGKTNLDQFATGLVGVRTPYPAPQNAFNPAMVPGGSSSGSAVAVARGLVSFALGSDTAGSGRVPAALNNIVGLKPSLGSISATGTVPACRTLDTVSVFATTTDDAWAVYRTMSGFDASDAYSRSLPVGEIVPVRTPLRLGVPDARSRLFGGDALAERAFDVALADFAALGANLVTVDLAPFFATSKLLYEGAFVAERYAATRAVIEGHPQDMLDVTRTIIDGARRFSAADCFDAHYTRAALKRQTESLWSEIDALVVPTFPRPRTVADLREDPFGPNAELGTYTNFVNLLDLCGLAVPARFRDDGFPAGMTLLAPSGADAALAGIGRAFHRHVGVTLGATGAPQPVTRETAVRTTADTRIEIAVVGAHMSGMALNHELLARGGRFVRAATTRDTYQLFALPGGPPHRPGLLRVGQSGHAIACEVWSLPPDGFGTFVASIPAPLTIGTVHLNDGSTPKGFLAESEAIADAVDISRFGGWRSYMKARTQS